MSGAGYGVLRSNNPALLRHLNVGSFEGGVKSGGAGALVRRRLEQAIERAIDMLDALDGDPDLEDGYDRELCCEDEGSNDDGLCTWADEGDQTNLWLS